MNDRLCESLSLSSRVMEGERQERDVSNDRREKKRQKAKKAEMSDS